MAPTKRKAQTQVQDQEPEEAVPARPNTASSRARVTRAAAKRASGSVAELPEPEPEVPRTKKNKKAKGTGKGKGKKDNPEVEGESNEDQTEKGEEEAEGDSWNFGDDGSRKKTIVIEHCKQCTSFKKRAILVKEGLEERVSGITVIVNPEKPRRGCFEVREEGGRKFISLLDMKRPFTPMKNLNMDKVISDIIDEISSTN